MDEYDLVVIGAGPGGYPAALEAAKAGMRTCLVDSGGLGGTCLNRGCIPTKTMLHTAQLAKEAREGAEIGLCAPDVRVDMVQLQAYKNQTVEKLAGGIGQLLRSRKVDILSGKAHVLSPHEVSVQGKSPVSIRAGRILIAVGSVPSRLPVPGINLPNVFNSDGILSQSRLFRSLIIIGGGVIGVEFASLFAALGCRVTVIEALDRVLANLDREFSQNLKMILKKQGVEIHTGASLKEIRREGECLACLYEEKGAEAVARGEAVLVAVGRRPATDGLFAPGSVPSMERGKICVDRLYRTDIPGIYAVGDVIGGVQLAHAATAEGLNAVASMLGKPPAVDTDVIPVCVYTSPEIASVGFTADEAAKRGIQAVKLKYLTSANGKSVLTRQERGFITVVAEKETGVIVGAQMMCARATDMIGEFSSAVANRFTVEQLARAIRPHPTFNETVWELLREWPES